MAVDLGLLELAEETGRAHWRLYRWDPSCLSFGRHEPAARRYDRGRILSRGIDCVRRPTGGRAVWHARELTYAVAAPTSGFGSLQHAYRAIHGTLSDAVRQLGAPALMAAARAAPGVGAGPCFSAAVGGEILVGGKKVVGSAQRRADRSLLQHGSMLLEDDQSEVRALQRNPSIVDDPPEAPLSRLLGRRIDFDAAAAAIVAVLTRSGVTPAPSEGPNEVLRRAERHYDTFRSETWTWER